MDHNAAYRAVVEELRHVLRTHQSLTLPPSALLKAHVECCLWPHQYPLPTFSANRICQQPTTHRKKQPTSEKLPVTLLTTAPIILYCSFNLTATFYISFFKEVELLVKGTSDTSLNLRDKAWSKLYWQEHHAALVDCVQQIGAPHFYLTIALGVVIPLARMGAIGS